MQVQMFGLAKSKGTRAAQRWFSERRLPVVFHDLRKRPPKSGDLRPFVDALGVEAVVDEGATAYERDGLRYLSATPTQWLARLCADPTLLRLPLVRLVGADAPVGAGAVVVGHDADGWRRLAAQLHPPRTPRSDPGA